MISSDAQAQSLSQTDGDPAGDQRKGARLSPPPRPIIGRAVRPWLSRAGPPNAASERDRYLGGIGQVVNADIDRLTLRGDQFGIDPGLVGRQRLGQRFEAGLQR